MRAALIAFGQALVDAIAIGMVGDDEDAGLGRCRRCRGEQCAGQKRWEQSHESPGNERTAGITNKLNWLIMINHGGGLTWGRKRLFRGDATLTGRVSLPHGARHERFPRHLQHLRDYELATSWLRPSFLKTLRSLDARLAGTGDPWNCAFTIR